MNPSIPQKKELDWVAIVFLTTTPVIALVGACYYIVNHGFHWADLLSFVVFFGIVGTAITAGYHRHFSHKSYDCNSWLKFFYLIFGAAAFQNSALFWSSTHRNHHQYTDDTERDPYTVKSGFWYAHIICTFYKDIPDYKNVPDLLKDPLVRWQDKYFIPIAVLSGFVLPMAVGWLFGRPFGGLLWGGLMRMVAGHHMTFSINSIAHYFGTQPYSLKDTSRNNWWLGPISFGEGYHNFHHAFQADYRNGVSWYQIDTSKWWIQTMAWLGQAWRLNRTPEHLILAARLNVEKTKLQEKLQTAGLAERWSQSWQAWLESGQKRLEAAMIQYQQAKVEYRHRKDQWSADKRRQWNAKMDEYQKEFRDAKLRWRTMMREMHRLPQFSPQGFFAVTAVMNFIKTRFLA